MAIRASRREQLDVDGEEIDLTAEESVDSALAGDVDIAELWEEHHAELHRICAKIVGDPITADDMVQETYLRALKHRDRLEKRPSLMPWLATVARRRSLDEIRSRTRVSPFEYLPEDETPDNDDPETRTEVSESVGEVSDALGALNDRERKLLHLQVYDDLSLAELAEADGSTVHSVRSVLVRVRTKLREAITQDVGAPAAAPLAGAMLWLRRRLEGVNLRVQRAFAGTPLDRVGEVLTAGAVTVALGATPAAVDTHTTAEAVDAGSFPAPRADTTAAISADSLSDGSPPPSDPDPGPGPSSPLDEPAPGSAAVDVLLPPDDVEATDDAAFTSFAVSGNGTTVLAAGTRRQGCVTGCTVLFRSEDAGSTWERLPAEGITGATVVAAPDFPTDPRLFAAGDEGLSISRDGGESFELALTTGPAPLALSPAFSTGDERLFIGTGPALVWDEATRSATPLVGPPASPSTHFAFQRGYPSSGHLLVGSTAPGSDDFMAAVYRCRHALSEDSCVESTNLDDLERPPALTVIRASGTVLAWAGPHVRRSTDGAVSFSRTSVPDGLHVGAVTSDDQGTVFAAGYSPSTSRAGVLRSTDDGRTWSVSGADTVLAGGVETVVALPNGRILAAPLAQAGGDIYCSDDGGVTWERSCA